MNFGRDGAKSPCEHCINEKLAKIEEEIFGDIVLLKAKTHRNHWPVARIIQTFADKHGVVQTVRLKLGSQKNTQRELVRPIAKTVLLVEDDYSTESQGLNQNYALILRGAR